MSREIASAIAEGRLRELRALSRRELAGRVGRVRCDATAGSDGNEYQVETEVRWDGKTGGDIRVIVAADGPGASAFSPSACSFIMRADGLLLDENPN